MLAVGQECPYTPMIPSLEVQQLRIKLHSEEAVTELQAAFEDNDVVAVADSIADSLVVVLGTAVACGIDIEPIFNEVMKSNATKIIDGHRREDGKWMKGPSFKLPNIAPLIEAQVIANT